MAARLRVYPLTYYALRLVDEVVFFYRVRNRRRTLTMIRSRASRISGDSSVYWVPAVNPRGYPWEKTGPYTLFIHQQDEDGRDIHAEVDWTRGPNNMNTYHSLRDTGQELLEVVVDRDERLPKIKSLGV